MKTTFTLLLTGMIFLVSCKKEKESFIVPVEESLATCILQTGNPTGRSYTANELEAFTCTSSHCGFLPLNRKNYWIYLDSIYDNSGVFVKAQYDTLRFIQNWRSTTDGLVWWESNIEIGLPQVLYANDSTIFKLEDRMFTQDMLDVRRELTTYSGDSTRYITSFSDNAAICRSIKLNEPIATKAGKFSDLVYFDKNAPYFRRDQIFFKPGIGVIRYVREKAVMGNPVVKLQLVSTLVGYHLE